MRMIEISTKCSRIVLQKRTLYPLAFSMRRVLNTFDKSESWSETYKVRVAEYIADIY